MAIQVENLQGLRAWSPCAAASLRSIQFGEERESASPTGRLRTTGEYALHIDCPWVIVTIQGRRIGSEESLEDADAALREALATRPRVVRVSEAGSGELTLEFDNSWMLLVRPSSLPGEAWRILAPGREDGHLVWADGRERWE